MRGSEKDEIGGEEKEGGKGRGGRLANWEWEGVKA